MARKVLGFSHLVYSTPNVSSSEATFQRLGYSVRSEQPRGENPSAKQPFLSCPLDPHYEMKLLVHPDKTFPAIEILRSGPANSESGPVFQLVIAANKTFDPAPYSGSQDICVEGEIADEKHVRMQLPCASLNLTVRFFEFLGLNAELVRPEVFRVLIPRSLSKSAFELILFAAPKARKAYFDQEGLTCLSMISMNVKKLEQELRQTFTEAEVLVGQPVVHKPFDNVLDILFVRVGNGEIYEFVA